MMTVVIILGSLVLTLHAVVCGYIISQSIQIIRKHDMEDLGKVMVVVIVLSLISSIVLDALAIYNAITL